MSVPNEDVLFPEMTPVDESSAMLHELYLSYRKHNFTRGEALLLIAYLVTISGAMNEDD